MSSGWSADLAVLPDRLQGTLTAREEVVVSRRLVSQDGVPHQADGSVQSALSFLKLTQETQELLCPRRVKSAYVSYRRHPPGARDQLARLNSNARVGLSLLAVNGKLHCKAQTRFCAGSPDGVRSQETWLHAQRFFVRRYCKAQLCMELLTECMSGYRHTTRGTIWFRAAALSRITAARASVLAGRNRTSLHAGSEQASTQQRLRKAWVH
jgi:hypothetical protein